MRSLHRAAASSGVRLSRRPSAVDQRRAAARRRHGRGRRARRGGRRPATPRAAASVKCFAPPPDPNSRSPRRSARSPSTGDCSKTTEPTTCCSPSTADGALPDRVRLATLDSYDGEIYRSGGTGALDQARFVRVPSTLDAGSGRAVDARDHDRRARRHLDADRRAARLGRVHGCSRGIARRSVLLPVGSRCRRADRRRRAVDGRRVPDRRGRARHAGARLDRSARRARRVRRRAAESARPGSTSTHRVRAAPRWRASWASSASAAISATRSRWATIRRCGCSPCADYTFQPSASGHSLARIDAMFARLLERETDPRAAASGELRRRRRRRRAVRGGGRHSSRASSASPRASSWERGSRRRTRHCARARPAYAVRRISRRGPRCRPHPATGWPSTSRPSTTSRPASR